MEEALARAQSILGAPNKRYHRYKKGTHQPQCPGCESIALVTGALERGLAHELRYRRALRDITKEALEFVTSEHMSAVAALFIAKVYWLAEHSLAVEDDQ